MMAPGHVQVPLSDIAVDEQLLAAVRDATASGWWSMGARVQELEDAFARFVGAEHGIAVSSGTAALHLALLATGCGSGDEVVLPSLNFVAAANMIRHVGATPVFCDIRGEGDLNLDPGDLEAATGPRTRAIVALHYGGFACDIDRVLDLAERRGLIVIEDAAHAPGAVSDGGPCGSRGHVGCFSFFANKNLPIGEGGMVVTSDRRLAERLRLLRSHGMSALSWSREDGHAAGYDVVAPGINYRLDELRAAIGVVGLARLPAANAARARLARRYRERLADIDGVALPFADRLGGEGSAHHLAVVLLDEDRSRGHVRDALLQNGIQTSVHYPPIHRFTAYREFAERRLPRTDAVAGRLLTLPLFPHMTDAQVDAVTGALTGALQRPAALEHA